MHYFLNGGRNERGVLCHPQSLALYQELQIKRLVVIPYAIVEEEWQRRWHDSASLFVVPELRIQSLTIFDTDPAEIAAKLQWADFVYLPGGAQKKLLNRMAELGTDSILRTALKSGTIKLLGGGSAGAMVMGNECLVGNQEVKAVLPGLGFIGDTIIDSHFTNRQREARLQAVLHSRPTTRGIGIDEDTAVLLNDELALQAVWGSGTVSVYHANQKHHYDSNTPIKH